MKKISVFILTSFLIISFLATPINANAATETSLAGQVSISSGWLNIRQSASTNSAIISSLYKGNYITLISKSGSWWYVEYAKGKYGYAHADYITTISGNAKTVNITSGTLNVRSGAGTSYSRIGSLTKGEIVISLSTSNGWSKILYSGTKTGYVSESYLSSTYSAISLKVPSYKQTDSRWANEKIGSSGKTFAQIGCATTAIAMMESYRTGTTIYPNAMAKKLNYTPSGSVYWPSNFVAVTSNYNYLSNIYSYLKSGKPIMLGAKNSYGSQHWVVITGFTGGSLTASRFTILDPGSSSRINLQQFLNAYPTFYKYFYYK